MNACLGRHRGHHQIYNEASEPGPTAGHELETDKESAKEPAGVERTLRLR